MPLRTFNGFFSFFFANALYFDSIYVEYVAQQKQKLPLTNSELCVPMALAGSHFVSLIILHDAELWLLQCVHSTESPFDWLTICHKSFYELNKIIFCCLLCRVSDDKNDQRTEIGLSLFFLHNFYQYRWPYWCWYYLYTLRPHVRRDLLQI